MTISEGATTSLRGSTLTEASNAFSTMIPEELYELLSSVWTDISFLVFFAMGFSALRIQYDIASKLFPKKPAQKKPHRQQPRAASTKESRRGTGGEDQPGEREPATATATAARERASWGGGSGWAPESKEIELEAANGSSANVLQAWEAFQKKGRAGKPSASAEKPLSPEAFRAVAFALLEQGRNPAEEVFELAEWLCSTGQASAKAANALLEAAGRAGGENAPELLERLYRRLRRSEAGIPTSETYEVLLGGYAAAGDEARVLMVVEEARAKGKRLSVRAHSVTVKGFLKKKMVAEALRQLKEMRLQGLKAPGFAVTQLLRMAAERGQLESVLQELLPVAPAEPSPADKEAFPPEAVALLFEQGARTKNLELLRRAEAIAKESKVPLSYCSYETLTKVYAAAGEAKAIAVFDEMVERFYSQLTDGSCVGILAQCAEGRQLQLAGRVVEHARERKLMTIPVYSALMKVYAYGKMYDKACDLYDQILADGLEPDATMYGCLMKFAVECGRTELSQRLFQKSPSKDIQNYMSLIRGCGRDGDLKRAFALLEEMQARQLHLDAAAYNCVLDVCVIVGDLKTARMLMGQMKKDCPGNLDVIAWNTLVKGHCGAGDLKGARQILAEMATEGCPPNDVTYNCITNVLASSGRFEEAWELVGEMETAGIRADNFTVSAMLKALKPGCQGGRRPAEADRVLGLLDREDITVCKDEVLLNTCLDVLIRLGEKERLAKVLEEFSRGCGLKLSPHTYGSLIKANGFLGRPEESLRLWAEMTKERGILPDRIVCGCMVDALVVNQRTEEAVVFVKNWKAQIPPNIVIYSTLIKGFANARNVVRAMEVYEMLKEDGLEMNTMAYNSLINCCVRGGATDKIDCLLEEMRAHRVSPDAITYSNVIKGHCAKGELEKALAVFRSMRSHPGALVADPVIYNTLLDGCVTHNSYDLADEILEDMEKERVPPSNHTLTTLVKMWGRRKRVDKACEVVRELPKRHRFRPNKQVATCLISTCIANQDVAEAMAVFRRLRDTSEFGSGPDSRAYGTLVQGLCRQGRFEEAVALVDEAYGLSGAKTENAPGLETEALERLLEEMARHGEASRLGMPLVERLRASRKPIDQRLWTMTLRSSSSSFGSGCGRAAATGGVPPATRWGPQNRCSSGGSSSPTSSFGGSSSRGGRGGLAVPPPPRACRDEPKPQLSKTAEAPWRKNRSTA